MIKAYNHWGLYPYYDGYNETWSDAKSRLSGGNPIHSRWKNTSGSVYHSMTVRGYELYSDGYRDYLIIDPNYNYYQSVDAQTYSGDCYYVLAGYTLYWFASVKGF